MAKLTCPKCGSTDISPSLSLKAYGQGSFFSEHKCNKCGYTGMFFPIVKKKVKKKTKKKKVKKTTKKKK